MFPAQHSNRAEIKGIIWRHLEKHQIQLEKVLLCLTTAVVTPNEFNILLVIVEQRGQEDQWQQRIAWLNYQGLLLENGTCHLPPHTAIPISPHDTKSNKVRLLLTTVCLTLDSPPLCTIRTNVMSPFRWKITSLCQIKKNRMCVALLWLCTSNTGQVLFKHSS